MFFSATSLILVGGGNSNMFYFHLPNFGEDDFQFDIIYFSGWVGEKPPVPRVFFLYALVVVFAPPLKTRKKGNPDECRDGKKNSTWR